MTCLGFLLRCLNNSRMSFSVLHINTHVSLWMSCDNFGFRFHLSVSYFFSFYYIDLGRITCKNQSPDLNCSQLFSAKTHVASACLDSWKLSLLFTPRSDLVISVMAQSVLSPYLLTWCCFGDMLDQLITRVQLTASGRVIEFACCPCKDNNNNNKAPFHSRTL